MPRVENKTIQEKFCFSNEKTEKKKKKGSKQGDNEGRVCLVLQ